MDRLLGKVVDDCKRACVSINFDKSHLVASHYLPKHLGLSLDFSNKGTFSVPDDRWLQLQTDIQQSPDCRSS